jgi:cytochrome d ubiquinol oxidase subunit II
LPLGGVLKAIKVDQTGHFIGTTWDWLSWQTVLVALTLIQGYVLIGSTYLVWKTTGELQQAHYKTAKIAAVTTLIGAILITIGTPIFFDYARERLFHRPQVYVFAVIPMLGVLLISLLIRSLFRKEERAPLIWTILLFLLTFIGLAMVVFPYIIPTEITIYEAAADPSALVFMIIFIGALIPVMLFYNLYQYIVFRGKITGGHYGE